MLVKKVATFKQLHLMKFKLLTVYALHAKYFNIIYVTTLKPSLGNISQIWFRFFFSVIHS